MNGKRTFSLLLILVSFFQSFSFSQEQGRNNDGWVVISNDEMVTISYHTNITTGKDGCHFVWVKAVYHTPEWQQYFADMIGSKTPVATTRTKAEYDKIYSYVRVRQVKCFSKAGKQLYDSGDDRSAGWFPVNASDPVGIVGEYLDKIQRSNMYD